MPPLPGRNAPVYYVLEKEMKGCFRATRALESAKTLPQVWFTNRYFLLAVKREIEPEFIPTALHVFDELTDRKIRKLRRIRKAA